MSWTLRADPCSCLLTSSFKGARGAIPLAASESWKHPNGRLLLQKPYNTDITLQTPIKSVDLFNALKRCQAGAEGSAVGKVEIADIIAGQEYETVKSQVYRSEQILLRETRFNLAFELPAPFLLNFARCLRCSRPLVQLALFLENDSLVFTDMCLHFAAPDLAAACLSVASMILKQPLQPGKSFPVSLLGVSHERVEEAADILLDLLELAKEK